MKKLLTLLLGVLIFFALAGASAFVAMHFLINREAVVVPALEGKHVAAAIEALQGLQLNLRIQDRESSATIPKDAIVTQIPEAGSRVKQGRSVMVVLSAGMARVRVPDMRGELLLNVRNRLQGTDLVLGRVTRVPMSRVPANHVVAQSPGAGQEVIRGSAVSVLVSLGRSAVTYGMPDLVGRPLEEGMAVVKSLRLRLADLAYAEYPGLPAGTILRHRPQAGEPVRTGMLMRLTVSKVPAVSEQVGTFSVLQYRVPDGLSARRLRIVLASEKGGREIYNQVSAPGKQIRLMIPVHGKTTAKIFLDDRLVSERIYY